MRDARRGLEIGEVALRETEVAVEAVDQDFEGVLQGVEMLLLGAAIRGAHARFRFEAEGAQIGEQVAEDLQLVGDREAIELQHDGGIERGDVAMPDIAHDAGVEHRGVASFETARHRQLGNAVALPEIFAEEKRVDAGGVAAHDHVLVVVGKNLRLDEVTRAEQLGDGSRFTYCTEGALPEALIAREPGALQFLASQGGDGRVFAQAEVPRHIRALETGERPHANVVKLREQERVDEVASIDRELWVIDRLLRNLKA